MTNPVPPRGNPDQPWRAEGTPPAPSPKRKMPGGWGRLVLTAVAVFLITDVLLSFFGGNDTKSISYTEFSNQLNADNISKLYSKGESIQGELKAKKPVPDGKGDYTQFETQRPAFANDKLWETLAKNKVTVTAEPVVKERSFLYNLLISLAPMLLLVVL
ncbi:ATP-dependent metallopeptidase FtsH/Yme1/Tma family protein, partial [Streptomyces sp. NPDC057654]|uniref:ATP-dependent metallopeptidase FtsH/Yme1/Tma family protein n=1 Tax=Streptomyces sp. NPDC057654 TaxID=3346196 RepID=UPI0036BED96F